MNSMIRTILLLLTFSARGIANQCYLQCQQNAPCVFGEANYSATHPVDFDTVDNSGYHCACPHGYTGLLCEVVFESCDGQHVCYHGGQCIPGLLDDYGNEQLFCNCQNASDSVGNKYVGKYCEYKAASICDAAAGTFCVNNGACNSRYPQYGSPCLCASGFEGDHCQYKTNTVPNCTLDCHNSGQCVLGEISTDEVTYWEKGGNDTGFMYCDCGESFDGELCDIPRTTCGINFCYHGGTCLSDTKNAQSEHYCDCTSTYTNGTYFAGRFCQYQATTICQSDDPSDDLFCVNNGTCKSDPTNGCKCPLGYTGFSCEFLTHLTDDQLAKYDDLLNPILDPLNETACTLVCENSGVCRNGVKEITYSSDVADQYNLPDVNQTSDDYQYCVCPDGYIGLRCEDRVDVCGSGQHVCLNGGECVTNGEKHVCDCANASSTEAEAYSGVACEHPATDICTIGGSDTVVQGLSFCVNGGTCKSHVAPGEPHAGCSCRSGWTGPHCEIKRSSSTGQEHDYSNNKNTGQTDDDVLDSLTKANQQNKAKDKNGGKVFGVVFSVLAMAAVTFLAISKALRRRKSRRSDKITSSLRFADRYRDRPPEHEINIAPRRDSTMSDAVYAASIASSSRDPMATTLSPNQPDIVDEDQPVIYMGPPRDEDGHELHSVNII